LPMEIDEALPGGGQFVVVRIADSGIGIAAPYLSRIFDPYFTTRENGTGIGLYMSLMIIEQNMEGTIEARNVGDGAEFRVVTPLANGEAAR